MFQILPKKRIEMYKILVLGHCQGLDLYCSMEEKIKIVQKTKEVTLKFLQDFNAVFINKDDFLSTYVARLEEACNRFGIPLFLNAVEFLQIMIEKMPSFESLKRNQKKIDAENEIFVGNSAKIRDLKESVRKLATQKCKILIVGETGTGKEILAESIFRLSRQTEGPFVKINCASIPPSLAESQMFGTEPGAYTDAVSCSGFLERAHRGTLFLDEIPDLVFELQAKFLRVLEEKKFFRIGGKKRILSDFRLLSASNRPGTELLRGQHFRCDLLYRISECILEIPPLRERCEDIPLLCQFFLSGSDDRQLSNSAMDKLMSYRWPGNVRELKNILRRSLFNSTGQTLYADDIVF